MFLRLSGIVSRRNQMGVNGQPGNNERTEWPIGEDVSIFTQEKGTCTNKFFARYLDS